MTEHGPTFGWRGKYCYVTQEKADSGLAGKGLYRFSSPADLFVDAEGHHLSHPLLDTSASVQLFATETRAFSLSQGGLNLLFEAISEERSKPCAPRLELISGLEGLGITSIGCRNK